MKQSIAILSLLLLAFTALQASALTIVQNGAPKAVIVIDDNAADTVKHAANELQTYIKRASGAEIAIITDSNSLPAGKAVIYIGESQGTKEKGLISTDLKPDGYHMVVKPGWMAILGNDYKGVPVYGFRNPWRYEEVYNEKLKLGAFGEAGSLYGVYHLLEKACGIRWYMHGSIGEVIPSKKTIAIAEGTYDKAPDFSYRYPWFCDFNIAPEEALWFRRAGFGAPAPVQIIHSFDLLLTSRPELKETHPEYFALIGGQRDFTNLSTVIGNGNLCLSNPGVVDEWIKYISDYFANHPEQNVFALSPNDGMLKICECEDCQSQLSPELGDTGKYSNYIWRFVDKVARAVGEKYPGKMVGCIAYEHYNAPPNKIDKLSSSTAVMICKSRGSYTDTNYKKKMAAAVNDWKQKTDNVYVWEYYLYSWPPWRGLPVAFPHIISQDMKFLKGLSKGEFIEAESVQPSDEPGQVWGHLNFPGMAHLNLYITAKCMWDSNADVDKLLSEYYNLFYGPASKDMRKFWTLAESIWNKSAGSSPINLYTSARIEALSSCLEMAKKNTKAGSIYRQRVELVETEFAKGRAKMFGTENRQPPVMTVKRSDTKVRLDGKLNQEVWKNSNSIGLINKDGSPADIATIVYAVHDSDALTLTYIANEPAIKNVKAAAAKRDQSSILADDTVEIYVSPDPNNHQACYQITVNSKGTIADIARSGSDVKPNYKWNSHAAAKARKEDDRWIVQLRIPLADLGITQITPGQKLAVNFYRNRTNGQVQNQTCWAPIPGKPKYTPDLYGTLILE